MKQEFVTTPAKLDLSRYRAGTLAEELGNIVSLPNAFRRIVRTMFVVGALGQVACLLLIPREEWSFLLRTGFHTYAACAGLLFGDCVGATRCLSIALRSVEEVLRIILHLTAQVARDYDDVSSGAVALPSGGELMDEVYHQIALPTIERTVIGSFGFLGRPALWFYRRSIVAAISRVTALTRTRGLPPADEEELQSAVRSGLAAGAMYSEQVARFTKPALEVVASAGAKIRFAALVPLWSAVVVFTIIVVLPLFVGWLLLAPASSG